MTTPTPPTKLTDDLRTADNALRALTELVNRSLACQYLQWEIQALEQRTKDLENIVAGLMTRMDKAASIVKQFQGRENHGDFHQTNTGRQSSTT